MYLYSFDRFFGIDKVCLFSDSTGEDIDPGDLLIFGNQYFLALGDNIAFEEQYVSIKTVKAKLIYKYFFTKPTLNLLHWMVETYYTTYKSVIKLFVPNDIQKLLDLENNIKKKKIEFEIGYSNFDISKEGQTLIVFPDLRTMFNSTSEVFRENESVAFLLSTHTEKQKSVHRWEVKKGLKGVVLCTYAEIFQDYHNLKKIIFVDPHKWYYANQQDPRYKVAEVLVHMAELYGAELQIVGI